MRRPAYHKLLRPSPKVEKYLGALEAAIMQHLWSVGQGSVREVVEALRSERTVAYTTGMTVMSRLADKGLLAARAERGRRAHEYRVAQTPASYLAAASEREAAGVVARYGEAALAAFAARLAGLSPEQRRRLEELAG